MTTMGERFTDDEVRELYVRDIFSFLTDTLNFLTILSELAYFLVILVHWNYFTIDVINIVQIQQDFILHTC